MATENPPHVPMGESGDAADAAVQRPWRTAPLLSSIADQTEAKLERTGFDRGPWLVVAFGAGIVFWFAVPQPWQWCAGIGFGALLATISSVLWHDSDLRGHLRSAGIALGLLFAAGIAVIWTRSELVGAPAIERPQVLKIAGYVLSREDQPARERSRLTLAIRDASAGEARKVRVNVPLAELEQGVAEGATVTMRARLMPPAPPMFPGSYNFARTAWFMGLSATGSALGPVEVISPASGEGGLAPYQRRLASHVRTQVQGSPGAIAAAFASGDRGGIVEADEDAMRDAGLTHLLSISGLHVSAVIGAAYLIAIKLLALWQWLALRVRLPLVAAGIGALAGIGYTLLTGSEVPTVRSCLAAMLVLIALALGRDALSVRMIAVAAMCVLILWPESLIGPSFQMSFSAVVAIVALHNSSPVKAFLAPREESWISRLGRRTVMLFITGLVIEIALMPIVLFHFHRAGVYGAVANVAAIPLVTFVAMPTIALALFLDLFGLGAPIWWIAENSIDLMLWIAHETASQPGSVKLFPQMEGVTFGLFILSGLWLALWGGKWRLLGLVSASVASLSLMKTPVPDVLISDDGRQVGITFPGKSLVSLRENRSDFAKDNLREISATSAEPITITDWEGAKCSPEFCMIELTRDDRNWTLLLSRSNLRVEERALAAACERADIVVADRWLPNSCQPRWLKADEKFLDENGGLAIILADRRINTVAENQGDHGWWRRREQ